MRPTLRDVAEDAKVSIATVSIVLRDVPNAMIGDETRQRVSAAARRLRYRHNALAAGLRKGSTDLVAFIADRLSSPILAAKLAAAEAELRAGGMRTILWHTARLADMEVSALKEIRSHMISGLIVGYAMAPDTAEILGRLGEDGVPMVLFEPIEQVAAHVVTVDREKAMHMSTRHLLSVGHRRIGLTGSEQFLDVDSGWGRGYARALREFGVAPSDDLIYHLPTRATYQSGYEVGKQLLAAASPPTALVCSDDEVAVGVMRACREKGVPVPDQLALVGFDDLPVAAFADVPLTTIGNPAAEAGRRAAEILLADMRRDQPSRPKTVSLQPELIVRESCGS